MFSWFWFPFFMSLSPSKKSQSNLHIIFQVALFPCTFHYDNLLLWVIMKHQSNDVYPIDQYWNTYFQIEAFYHEAIRFQSKTVVWRMGGFKSWSCHLQHEANHLNLGASMSSSHRMLKIRTDSASSVFSTILEQRSYSVKIIFLTFKISLLGFSLMLNNY